MSKLALAVLSALLTLMAACRGAEPDTAVLADGPTTVPAFTESTALHYVDKLTEIWGKGKIDITFFQFDESYNIPHNSVDLTTDPEIRNFIYDKISEWTEDKK